MGLTSIEWTDRSSNPIRAYNTQTQKRGWFCTHESPGCKNCYAEAINRRFGNGLAFIAQNRNQVRFELDEKELRSWAKLKPGTKVFVCDMTDLFQADIPDEMIDRVFAAMALCPEVIFQVLTKRAERMLQWFGRYDGARDHNCADFVADAAAELLGRPGARGADRYAGKSPGWPLPNVWLGVSVEDQRRADERIPFLLRTPAAVRFLSMEPLLGAVDVSRWLWPVCWHWAAGYDTPQAARAAGAYAEQKRQALVSAHARFIDWVILGGESGPRARPCDVRWLESIAAQCQAAGVPVFVKQLGSVPVMGEDDWRAESCAPRLSARNNRHAPQGSGLVPLLLTKKGGQIEEFPRALQIREFPEVCRG